MVHGLGFTLLLAVFAAGCAVGPNYHRPPLDVPVQYRAGPPIVYTNSLGELPWWQVFKDENLQDLIHTGLTNNYDLRIAIARVEQASAIAAQNRAAYFPQLTYNGSVSRGKNALNGAVFPENGQIENLFLISGSASWEPDVWGRIRRLNESARAQYLASQEARRDVTLSVISQIAQGYFRLLALDQLLDIAYQSTNSFAESLRIFGERFAQGTASELDTSAADALLQSAAATVPDLERQIVAQENLINVLVGRNPGPVPRSRTLLEQDLGLVIPPGLPSELLTRRPDIREAEQNLRSANAQVGVAVANFFPQFSLTSLFGQVSPEASAFTAGAANAWSIGASVTGPIFEGGLLRAQHREALAARNQAVLTYQYAVLTALQQVSDDLIAVQKYGDERTRQARAARAYDKAFQVSRQRYLYGLASYYEVLQQQQELFPAENSLVQAELNQFLSFIQLYQDLGGGFGNVTAGARDGR